VWLNEKNEWIYPHLRVAQERMTELVARVAGTAVPHTTPGGSSVIERALRQAARELLLAQSSDWPFILRTGTSPEYACKRVTDHLLRFNTLYEQLIGSRVDENWLAQIESQDDIFPGIDYRYFG
jgi:1,4-alpha-glucan branching enzyme